MLSITADKTPGIFQLTCEKQKDAEAFEPLDLVRYTMQLDGVVDEDGNPETSCVIRLASDRDVETFVAKSTDARRAQIRTYIQQNPGSTMNSLYRAVGGNRSQTGRIVQGLLREGVIEDRKERKTSRLYVRDEFAWES